MGDYKRKPLSRNEEILRATIDGTEYNRPPMSAEEELLIELKEAIEAGGGGGGTTNYNALSNKPQINGVELSGNKTSQDLHIDAVTTEAVTANTEVGAINSGDTIPSGTGLTAFLKKLLIKELAPTTTFTASGSGVKEVGTSVTPTLQLKINDPGTGTPDEIGFYRMGDGYKVGPNLDETLSEVASFVFDNSIYVIDAYGHVFVWNGSSWVKFGNTVLRGSHQSIFLEYKNKVYIIADDLYAWNGLDMYAWEVVSDLPFTIGYGDAVVFNNEIHVFGTSGGAGVHYKWDGTAWSVASTMPYAFEGGKAVVFNNEIHLFGGQDHYTDHYKWDGTEWTQLTDIPYKFIHGSCVVYNNAIHLFGTDERNISSPAPVGNEHYKWNGSAWSEETDIPYSFWLGGLVVYAGKVYLVGGGESSDKIYTYAEDALIHSEAYQSGVNTYSYTMTDPITSNTTLKGILSYKKSDNTDATVEKSATYTFVMASYYGAVTTAPTTKSEIIALTKNVKNSKGQTATFNLSNQRSCYCYPASFGNLTSIKDANNFEYINSYTKTTVVVDGVNYNVYTLTDPVTASSFKQVYS